MGGCSSGSGCSSGCGQGGFGGLPVISEEAKVIWASAAEESLEQLQPLALTDRASQSIPAQPLRAESQQAREHLSRMLLKIEQRKIPFWTHLDLTYKCNTDCIHCYCQHLDSSFGGKYDKQDLTTAEVVSLLDQLADYGALNLTLSGGELFVRKDFFDIAFYASRKCHFALSLYSNGTLINEKIADRLAELAPVSIEMSLQGATPEVHDAIVQRPGSFQRVVRAVQLLRARGINVVLKSTLMQPNIHQADDIVRLSQKLGASAYRNTIEVTPKNDGDASVQRYELTDEQALAYIGHDFPEPWHYQPEIPLEEARKKSTCGTGTVACYISPYGDVYPCIQLLISMGNIREHSFKEIWEAPSELRRKLESIQSYGDMPDCQTCEYVQLCQRCYGLAYLETGDITKCYKAVLKIAKAKTIVNARMKPATGQAESPTGEKTDSGMLIETRSAGLISFGH